MQMILHNLKNIQFGCLKLLIQFSPFTVLNLAKLVQMYATNVES